MYEVVRNYEFVDQMSNILSISSSKQEQLYFLVHSSDNNESDLATFLMSYYDEIDLGKLDSNGMNVWHYACYLGNVRLLKLLLNVTNDKGEWKKYLNMPADVTGKQLCFHLAVQQNRVEMVKFLKDIANNKNGEYEGVLDINCKNGQQQVPMQVCLFCF